ncbi:Quinone oxidoreductase-like protein 2 [Blattella germanica]|nr:Quinone oxidoreductase-like protein 2 [Blattella germanica]
MSGALRRALVSTALFSYRSNSKTLTLFNVTQQTQTGIRFKSSGKYRAAVLHEFKKPLVIEEQKHKKLDKHDVRIKVEFCSVNSSDIMICNSLYEINPKLPFIPGFEVSGEIIELGAKAGEGGLKVGDRVDVWQLPNQVKRAKAVALIDSYTTALIGLSRRAKLQETDTVLITAGGGSLGLAALDIAANLFRAKVIAVCETEEQAAVLRERGAWAALTYNPKETVRKCDEVTGSRGVRIVFDAVGRIVVVAGTASRLVPSIKTSELLPRSFSLIGVSLRNYRAANHKVYRQVVQDAIDMADQGLVHPVIAKQFPLDKINDAMQYISDGKATGKVIISMKNDD